MPLGSRRRWGFAVGDIGFNFVWQSIELYLLFFYSQVLELPLAWAAGIFFVGAVIDWIADPVIGALADRTAARVGRMRGWILGAGPAMGIALVLAFAKPPLALAPLFWWALASHILLRVTYSAGNIPYAALTARITRDAGEQARMTGLRMQCAALGGLTVAAIYAGAPQLTSGGDPARFFLGAALLALLVQPFLLATWATTIEVADQPGPLGGFRPVQEARALIAIVRRSAMLRRTLGVILFAGLTTSVLGKSILFLFAYDLNRPDAGYYATFAPSIALLVAAPLWVRLVTTTGFARALIVAVTVHVSGILGLAGAIATALPVTIPALMLLGAIIGTTGMSVIFWATVPATVQEASNGSADASARVYALATTARKLAQALASPLLALGLSLSSATVGQRMASPTLAVVAMLCGSVLIWLAKRTPKIAVE